MVKKRVLFQAGLREICGGKKEVLEQVSLRVILAFPISTTQILLHIPSQLQIFFLMEGCTLETWGP